MDQLELRHRLLTRLTAIKLSLQWLQRHPERCAEKRLPLVLGAEPVGAHQPYRFR